MKPCIIALGSMTYALRGQQILSGESISSKITKLEADKTRRGCAYGLEISCMQLNNATRLLKKYNVAYSEIIR